MKKSPKMNKDLKRKQSRTGLLLSTSQHYKCYTEQKCCAMIVIPAYIFCLNLDYSTVILFTWLKVKWSKQVEIF